MRVEGDGPEGQPAEGVATLTDLTAMLDDGEDGGEEEDAPEESEEGEVDPDEAEGEEAEQEDEPEEDDQEEATVTLKHDGKEVSLKQSEVVELAQKGFDYTLKTMALSEDRKAVESERAQAAQLKTQNERALSQSIAYLQGLESYLQDTLGTPPPVEMAQRDAGLYIAQKEQYEARRGQLAEATRAIANLQDEQARSRQAWIAEKSTQTEASLRSTLPGWNDNTLSELNAYISKHGLGWQGADDVMYEKGFWELAHKARQFDELMEKKAQMKPVSKLPKVAAPSTRTQPPQLAKRQAAHKQFREKPNLQNLADLL